MKKFLWKVFFLLAVLSAIGAAGIIPYSSVLTGGNIPSGIPDALMMTAVFLQSFLMTVIAAFFGLKLSLSTGLGVPVLENMMYRREGSMFKIKEHVIIPVIAGLVCGIIMVVSDLVLIELFQLKAAEGVQIPVWWKGLCASFYGGISEEILMRLFVLNFIVYIFNLIDRNRDKKSSRGKVVTAMIISSVIFGVGHLVAAIAVGTAEPGYIARTLILNFIPGMIFGWLYWKRSFLSAMAAHFATDIVIHVIARFILDNVVS